MKQFYMILADEELEQGCIQTLLIPTCKTLTGAIDGLHINRQQDIIEYLEQGKIPHNYRVYEVKEVDIITASNDDVGYNEV